ncbi:MAG: xanthine phosphoribosyltransferase [Oscillospiraceae bacterium]|jgi:xanthine phosphoribosyltransferase|nr:xanthine phosphoribosyltransferase [Oscillospiraceae bacterium]
MGEQLYALQRRIIEQGQALPGGVLRVDSFVNQRVDMRLMKEIGDAFARRFEGIEAGCVMTVESSGIAPAGMTALAMGLPLLVCKKQSSKAARGERLSTPVRSFTKDTTYEMSVSREYLPEGARVLFVDDFLATGEAALGAARLIEQAGAILAGIGIVIEKSFQPGRGRLERLGAPIVSLARITKMRPGERDASQSICFYEED